MRAAAFTEPGPPEVLRVLDVDEPKAADAHREIETGHGRGKVVLRLQ